MANSVWDVAVLNGLRGRPIMVNQSRTARDTKLRYRRFRLLKGRATRAWSDYFPGGQKAEDLLVPEEVQRPALEALIKTERDVLRVT